MRTAQNRQMPLAMCVYTFTVLFLALTAAIAVEASVIAEQDSDGGCHCSTELTLNLPPCSCPGMVDLVKENEFLKEEVKKFKGDCFIGLGLPVSYESPHVVVDGVRWTKFWWYNPVNGWPAGTTDVLGVPYGSCSSTSSYCFGRLPGALREGDSELLAIDSAGTVYRWQFDPTNPTAHAAWNAFYHHLDQSIQNSEPWDPHVVSGPSPSAIQDSFMYRLQGGLRSLMLDDDNGYCYSSLSMGIGLNGANSFMNTHGPGVELLFDSYCQRVDPKLGLILYFRDDDDCSSSPCSTGRECVDKVNGYLCV